ncbi:MAG: hypothetical protein FD180_2253 [Planctomycetota bacterium]|nr:MAG: hypothetical protein FD180_2253 [Planctomycetota bacterium]
MRGLKELMEALIDLPEVQLKPLMRNVLGGSSVSQASRDIGVTPQALSESKERALKKLRSLLQSKGHSLDSLTGPSDSSE